MNIQVGANNKDEISFSVGVFTFSKIVSAAIAGNANIGFSAGKVVLGAASKAKAVIDLMDAMIAKVDNQRSGLGAIQNHSPALFNFYF